MQQMLKKAKCVTSKICILILLILVILLMYLLYNHKNVTTDQIKHEAETPHYQTQTHVKAKANIPMILHQAYTTRIGRGPESHSIRIEYKEIIAKCLQLNPQWEYYLWRDEDIELFIQDHFPWMMKTFRRLTLKIEKSDIIRYMALYHYGGIYLDMDVECLKPLYPSVMSFGPAFLDQERYEQARIMWGHNKSVMTSAMGSVPNHPFFLAVLAGVESAPPDALPAMGTTGPLMLTRVYLDWVRKGSNLAYPVTLLEPEVFSPRVDGDFRSRCRKYSSDFTNDSPNAARWRKIGCNSVMSASWKPDTTDPNITLGRHLFTHLGWNQEDSTTKRFDIRELAPNVKFYKQHKMAPLSASHIVDR